MVLASLASHVLHEFGIPAAVQHWAQQNPAHPDRFTEPRNIAYRSVVPWNTLGRSPGCSGMGWRAHGLDYLSFQPDLPALRRLDQTVELANWQCDIRDVAGFSSSKSDLHRYATPDEMVEADSPELLSSISEEQLRNNLQHPGIRILHGNSDYFLRYAWDRRVFLINSDGSHHLAAARYIAGHLGIRVPLKGRLVTHALSLDAVAELRHEYECFGLPDDTESYLSLHDPMHAVRAPYIWLPLPSCLEARLILLPRNSRRAVRVATVLRQAGHFDIGEHLSALTKRQMIS